MVSFRRHHLTLPLSRQGENLSTLCAVNTPKGKPRLVLWLMLCAVTLTACASSDTSSTELRPVWSPTPDLLAQGVSAQATLDAGTAVAAVANTQIALANAQNTSVAAQLTATPASATQAWQETQQALSVAQTEQALARLNADATATAASAQTQDALRVAQAIGNMTATASTRTTAEYIQQEAQARRDEFAEMQLERERTTQLVKTWAGWVIFAILFGLLLLALWRLIPVLEMRLRIIKRGEHLSPLYIADARTRVIITDPDRNPRTVIVADGQGHVTAPAFTGDEWHDRTTARTQAVQLAAALPPARAAVHDQLSALYSPNVESTNSNTSTETEVVEGQVVVVEPNEVRPWLEEMQQKLLTGGDE